MCIENLAAALSQQGLAAEAKGLHWQELELKMKVLGLEHQGTMHSMGNLALAVRKQGRAAEAEELTRHEL
jgi:hypothetical protein